MGEVDALGQQASGASVEQTYTFDAPATSKALHLDLEVGVGHIVVERSDRVVGR